MDKTLFIFGKVKKSISRNDAGKRHFQKGGSIIVFGKAVHLSARFDKVSYVTYQYPRRLRKTKGGLNGMNAA
jgi:hypothetical protein